MAKKLMAWKTKGMNRDISVSAFNPEFAFENRNLRLSTNEANTTMSWVNERGTLGITIVTGNWVEGDDTTMTTVTSILGTPIGIAVINHQLVLFTTDTLRNFDYIYILKYADSSKTEMLCKILFGGDSSSLGFDIDHPLDTRVSYESETVQKVYWTDGKNQPRVINVVGKIRNGNTKQFDFIPTLRLQEDIYIKKMLGANGMFAPGVIQYAFTYYNKNGQESNIFYTSPLQYISFRDRGASPEDRVENAFKITVENVDTNFDYLRIYSIQRTSIDGTPICKRIQDIALDNHSYSVSYIDIGTSGDSLDPTELLYKGGEVISALTMEQKDSTLFLGNLKIERQEIGSELRANLKRNTNVYQSTRTITALSVSTGSYIYASQLTAYNSAGNSTVPCGGFKYGDTYRLGVQFQHVTGKWSDPVWIKDETVSNTPGVGNDNIHITLPSFSGTISNADSIELMSLGYKRVRAVVVFPKLQDRNIICQGVINPTLWTNTHRYNDGDLYAQSSWFFRPSMGGNVNTDKSVEPVYTGMLEYTHRGIDTNVPESECSKYIPGDNIRKVEVQGDFDVNNRFQIDKNFVTFHSPDIEFDSQLTLSDYSNTGMRQIGFANFSGTLSDIDIQTETPTVSNLGGGFIHKSFQEQGTAGIVSGLFYDDFILDDAGDDNIERIEAWDKQRSSAKWMVYLWNRSGSLNNDINRPSNKGTQTSILKKKVISNLRYANTQYGNIVNGGFLRTPQIFNSDEPTILKYGSDIYMGNIDTMLTPDNSDGDYYAFESDNADAEYVKTLFTSTNWWKTFNQKVGEQYNEGIYHYTNGEWEHKTFDIGDGYLDLILKKASVRMKYKSTQHMVFSPSGAISWINSYNKSLPIIEITQNPTSRFGGNTDDALRENVWVPCGEPQVLSSSSPVNFYWEYGDTYFQRWDCLKTYPFTHEDVNQLVEIGSFVLETRVNIDGRYDRNRGQMNNLNMTPQNFNLLNPVYSQVDNFFSYRIMPDDYYKNTRFPNQVTWSKTKENGADVDLWTNVTLASILELDGDKGEITSLERFNNYLFAFQDTGIAQILYNDNVQIQSTAGVPIEIANSGKVQGKDYKSDMVGCSDKWSIQTGNNGLYFIDSNSKDIYLFNGQLTNISSAAGFNSWSKLHIPSGSVKWNPMFSRTDGKSAFVTYYDRMNQELFFINYDTCLVYSEKFGVFTSFYDYDNTPFFTNLDDTGIWVKSGSLYRHQAGEYCNFFGTQRPYSMVLVGNPEPQTDKTFTNLEFRACVDGDGEYNDNRFTPFLPFDSLDTWNEYQHGIAYLNIRNGHSMFRHHTRDNQASLIRKFRIWRCDIPRDNWDETDTFDETFDETFHPVARERKHPNDRMRNPWLYLRLRKDYRSSDKRVEIHDVIMTYFD